MSQDAGIGGSQAAAAAPDLGAAASQIVGNIPGQQQQQQPQGQGNPAWKELYDIMPSQLHGQMRPILDKWEQGVQSRFQQHADDIKRYEPYADLVNNNVPMDTIEQSLALAQLIDSDPQGFLEQMNAFFGPSEQQQLGQEPQYGETFETQEFDIAQDPRFQQIQQQQDIIAQFLNAQLQQEQEQEADSALDNELTQMQQKYGDFDERYVLTLAANGMPLEEAVQEFQNLVGNIRNTPRSDAGLPNIVPPGNGVPSEQFDVASLGDGDRKKLVMNILRQASQNRG